MTIRRRCGNALTLSEDLLGDADRCAACRGEMPTERDGAKLDAGGGRRAAKPQAGLARAGLARVVLVCVLGGVALVVGGALVGARIW